jgi:SPP1 family predicted phage head-tail adaptor
MKAGKLNRQITIQTKTLAVDADGYSSESWADTMTVWSEVLMSGGGEFYAAQKVNAETNALFKVRHSTTIDDGSRAQRRVKFGTRYFEILNIVDPDGMRDVLNISAKEVT